MPKGVYSRVKKSTKKKKAIAKPKATQPRIQHRPLTPYQNSVTSLYVQTAALAADTKELMDDIGFNSDAPDRRYILKLSRDHLEAATGLFLRAIDS